MHPGHIFMLQPSLFLGLGTGPIYTGLQIPRVVFMVITNLDLQVPKSPKFG